MNVLKKIILLLIFVSPFPWGREGDGLLFAQQKAVQYDKDFVFKEGIYLSFFNFKNNSPVPSSKIIFSSNKNDKDFLKYVLDKTTFTYIDSLGKEQEVKTDNAWGYSSNGNVYINHGTDFNRVNIIGSICHFVATVPVRVGMSDPFYNNDPFYNPQQFTYVSNQYVIDFDSGKVLEFDVDNMEMFLQKDDALYKEFSALKKKQKRNSIFLYLRKFNEKHPVYFPE
ncbi:MAG: hypothetical protein HY841_08065 [Bacteroidetes bacterium]|nr:hypothetical protein [Bacteroidota bacterium]